MEVRATICEEIRKCLYFALMIDETQDISRREQGSVCIRYVDENLNVKERFLGFWKVDRADAQSVYSLIKNVLNSLNLDMNKITAQFYDGASAMSG